MPEAIREIEVESVAFIVCRRHGVRPESASYLAQHIKDGGALSLDIEKLNASFVDADSYMEKLSPTQMQLLYGPQATVEKLNASLVPFYEMRNEHRRRFEERGDAISYRDAVAACEVIAPLLTDLDPNPDPDPDPQYAELRAIVNAITFPCIETPRRGFVFQMSFVRAILEGFEREIDEG